MGRCISNATTTLQADCLVYWLDSPFFPVSGGTRPTNNKDVRMVRKGGRSADILNAIRSTREFKAKIRVQTSFGSVDPYHRACSTSTAWRCCPIVLLILGSGNKSSCTGFRTSCFHVCAQAIVTSNAAFGTARSLDVFLKAQNSSMLV